MQTGRIVVIKAVFFDLYGTLARFQPPREEVQARACEPFGFKVAKDGLVQGYAVADEWMAKTNASPLPLPKMNREQRAGFFAEYERLVLFGTGINVDLQTASQVWAAVRKIPYGLALFDDVLPTMDRLKWTGQILATLSNITEDIQALSHRLGLAPYMDFAITSWEVGKGKPHAPIFLAALERAGVPASEALMVGDSYSSDVQGARGVGIRPLLLDREGIITDIDDCTKIRALPEVMDHL
ncbi:MAG: HAD family hydrolase [Dehalococcoidia bacterium]|nr:HAD family hydrolase [Dehalococcoidia bacterium]